MTKTTGSDELESAIKRQPSSIDRVRHFIPIGDRGFLQELRDTAAGMAAGNLNPDWVRAYLALADAADRLDAMDARCTVPPAGGWLQPPDFHPDPRPAGEPRD